MSKIRMGLIFRLVRTAGVLGLLAGSVAEAQTAVCTAYATYVPTMRWEGLAEEVGQVLIECAGGTPTPAGQPIPTVNVQVFTNTNITGRLLSGNFSEAVLIVDEPLPANQQVCATPQSGCPRIAGTPGPNVFQGTQVTSNAITFFSVPFDPPGAAVPKRYLRIANIRANANALDLGTPLLPGSVTIFLSISGGGAPQLQNTQLVGAYAAKSLSAWVVRAGEVELRTCASANKVQFASLNFREVFPTSFRHRPAAGPQNELRRIYNTENIFYNPSFPPTYGMDRAGRADFGTRLQASFSGIPAGATLHVPASVTTASGDTLSMTATATGPFTAVTPGGDGLVALSQAQGAAVAVWEVTASNPASNAEVNIPVSVSYNSSSVSAGEISVKMDYAPESNITNADGTSPLPRFVSTGQTILVGDILLSCPGAPYTVATSPAGQLITVDGKIYVAPQSFNWAAGSVHSIGVPTPQGIGSTRQALVSWSDSGAVTHNVTAPASPITYLATFKTQHQLSKVSVPGNGGSIVTTPVSADGFFDAGATVQVTAAATAGFGFLGFSGDLLGSTNPQNITISGPRSVTATFVNSSTGQVTSLNPTSATASAFGGWGAVTAGTVIVGDTSFGIAGAPYWLKTVRIPSGFAWIADVNVSGSSRSAVLAIGSNGQTRTLTITQSSVAPQWAAAASGGYGHSLGMMGDGTVRAWGYNEFGQLGDGTKNGRILPVAVSGLASARSIEAGYVRSMALLDDGNVVEWGRLPQAGYLPSLIQTIPTPVGGLWGVSAISAGLVALKGDGTVWTWGAAPAQAPAPPPAQVSNLSGIVAIASRGLHFLALRSDGTVWAWGSNGSGQLGNGNTVDQAAPVQVAGLAGVVRIAAGDTHSLALKGDGTVWAWGSNSDGQIGDGVAGNRLLPAQVINLTGVAAIAAGSLHSLALRGDGGVRAWGRNTGLQLGDGTYEQRSVPVAVIGLPAIASISGGAYHSLAVGIDGRVWAWGYNGFGQLGDGTRIDRAIPAAVLGPGVMPGLRFAAVTPCRVVDTRWPAGSFGGPFMVANTSRSFELPQGGCGIPSTAKAYSLNVTVVPRTGQLQWLTLWPAGVAQPGVSTLNSYGGDVVANAAIVPAGTNGAVSVFVTDDTEVIIDVNGYFDATAGSSFYADTPCRVVDTRWPAGPLGGPIMGASQARSYTVPSGGCGIASNATAYAMNYTVVPSGYLGYLSTWPAGQSLPVVSTLNSWRGKVVANAAIVPAGTGGGVQVYVTDPTHVILDINGHFAPSGLTGALLFYPVTPCRVADTRGAAGSFGGPILGAGSTRSLAIPQGGCGIPATAKAYSVNVTVVPSGPLSWLSAWPAGTAQPVVSTLNSWDGAVVANAAIVPAGTNGAISLFVTDATHVILDINGYFQ